MKSLLKKSKSTFSFKGKNLKEINKEIIVCQDLSDKNEEVAEISKHKTCSENISNQTFCKGFETTSRNVKRSLITEEINEYVSFEQIGLHFSKTVEAISLGDANLDDGNNTCIRNTYNCAKESTDVILTESENKLEQSNDK